MRKPLSFIDSSLDDLKTFPGDMQSEIVHQQGLDPDDWMPFSTLGGRSS